MFTYNLLILLRKLYLLIVSSLFTTENAATKNAGVTRAQTSQ